MVDHLMCAFADVHETATVTWLRSFVGTAVEPIVEAILEDLSDAHWRREMERAVLLTGCGSATVAPWSWPYLT